MQSSRSHHSPTFHLRPKSSFIPNLSQKSSCNLDSIFPLNELKRLKTLSIDRPYSQMLLKNDIFFSPIETEWTSANEKHYKRSMDERHSAKRLADEVVNVVKIVDQETKQRQLINTHKLGIRISSISYWREELTKEIVQMKNKIFDLDGRQKLLEKQLDSLNCPLMISLKCLDERRKRIGVDAIRDNVDINLYKEIDDLKKCQRKLKCLNSQADEQNKLNVSAQEACEKDMRNKVHAQELDNEMFLLHDTTNKVDSNLQMDTTPYTVSHPLSWAKYSYENIKRSQKERDKTTKLCNKIDEQIKSCNNEIQNQLNATNVSLNIRIQKTLIARNNLQFHHQQVIIKIQEQERMAEKLKKSMLDKDGPLKLVQTRLQERNKRIDMELCMDSVTTCLNEEMLALKDGLSTLKSKLLAVLSTIERLQKLKQKLEDEINVKNTSLDIDGRICLSLRRNIHRDHKVRYIPTFPLV